ncbi:MAG: FISUMP domain-containing protein [Candidatus Pseudobacter hemicellulosilyticus]|uniref:FISUMP domain-containing protein n=1 Tax=Candidatus Pseudobacter hemicellulosilyticus TaxID=3121375 RepID=A0AAJ5WWC3_9BACT|nr:MAG: FISUMP domain-containing protein [Pseudobacter sp.]
MRHLLLISSVLAFFFCGCKKDDAPPTLPTVATSPVSGISGSTATGGGVISDNGNADITASGVCWSRTNNMPTITDDTTKGGIASGNFTVQLNNLQPSTTYYVRAYAINSVGTAYGEVVTFNTGNGVPEARMLSFEGQAAITNKIKISFTYYDAENDPQGGTTYQWIIAANAADTVSSTGTAINGATDSVYTIAAGDLNKFLRVTITPKSSAGASTGNATHSKWVGPVGPEPTSVTFTYNGQEVTYGIITSPTTGNKWLDRNLGASQVATSSTDYLAYGDLFQWGRPADGHQLMNWSSSTTGLPLSNTTETKYSSNIPNGSLFVITNTEPYDWVNPINYDRWAANAKGVCPFSWHIPNETEWKAEGKSAITAINLTNGGQRAFCCGGILVQTGTQGYYWSSTNLSGQISYFTLSGGTVPAANIANAGYSVRCIKD